MSGWSSVLWREIGTIEANLRAMEDDSTVKLLRQYERELQQLKDEHAEVNGTIRRVFPGPWELRIVKPRKPIPGDPYDGRNQEAILQLKCMTDPPITAEGFVGSHLPKEALLSLIPSLIYKLTYKVTAKIVETQLQGDVASLVRLMCR
ncbi:MAG: hypothetical protein ACYCOU_23430 [Sulfobacillus sp.]